MIDPIIFRQADILQHFAIDILYPNEVFQIAFEITQENFIILRRKQFQNIAVIFLQMPQKMQKYGICRRTAGIMIMSMWQAHRRINNMPEKLLT